MKITIIYDNTAFREDLKADWGFSCLVEEENTPNILFDTGANGKILLNNMEKLGIDYLSIEEIFISHLHSDHTGGLNELLKTNCKIEKIYTPSSLGLNNEIILEEPVKIHPVKSSRSEVFAKGKQFNEVNDNVFSTGKLEGIEQSMGVKTEKGIVLIIGCSHPYMGTILDIMRKFGKIYAVIGGLHGFSEFDLFKDLELICPAHCTQHKEELKKIYPQKCVEGGAGKIITI